MSLLFLSWLTFTIFFYLRSKNVNNFLYEPHLGKKGKEGEKVQLEFQSCRTTVTCKKVGHGKKEVAQEVESI